MTAPATRSVVFVHGLWVHATAWAPWEDHFRAAGYETHAPGWPGEPSTVDEAKAHPESVAGHGINDVTEHYGKFIATLPNPPIVIGHSFGGLITQKLLAQGRAAAGVAIDPAPIKGVLKLPLSALRVASIVLRNPKNRSGSVALSAKEFRYGFTNALTQEETDSLYPQMIPSPGKPLFEDGTANFALHSPAGVDIKNSGRGPLLLIGGGQDNTVPISVVRSTAKLHRKSTAVTDTKEFADRGHSLTIDHGWQEIADYAIGWLGEKGFSPT